MAILKRCYVLGLGFLCCLLVACQTASPNTPNESDPTITTETEAESVTNSPNGVLRSAELTAFFETHRETLVHLSKALLDKDVQYAFASDGYMASYYVDNTGAEKPFNEDLKAEFLAYIELAQKETAHDIVIEMNPAEGKRVVYFTFGAMLSDARIVYMPDGYAQLSHNNPNIKWSEGELAENWYSYWVEYEG